MPIHNRHSAGAEATADRRSRWSDCGALALVSPILSYCGGVLFKEVFP